MVELIYSLGFGGANEAPPISLFLASSSLVAASHKVIPQRRALLSATESSSSLTAQRIWVCHADSS